MPAERLCDIVTLHSSVILQPVSALPLYPVTHAQVRPAAPAALPNAGGTLCVHLALAPRD